MGKKLVLIIHNVRSAHNVGSMLRTAEGLGIDTVFMTGYTPYPSSTKDSRLPHIAAGADAKIAKTALGAQNSQKWKHLQDIGNLIDSLVDEGWIVAGLEQEKDAKSLPDYFPPDRLAIIVGNEKDGLEKTVLERCTLTLQIPMKGEKESFNVAEAAAMAMYGIVYGHRMGKKTKM